MTDLAQLHHLFYASTGMDPKRVERLVGDALHGMDDGELYLEYSQSESIGWDDGQLRSASRNNAQGFGLRSVLAEATGFAHASVLDEAAIARAAETVRAIRFGQSNVETKHEAAFGTNRALYPDLNPLDSVAFADKISVLQAIDAYLRGKDPRVKQVSASLSASWQAVQIIKGDGRVTGDIRPLVRLNISVVVEQNGRMESGSTGAGGRASYAAYVTPEFWRAEADKALAQALINLESRPAPAGEMQVVLGNGWCGVLLHEAVGHGLEGDFNRKGTSTFSGMIGQRVASPGVTVVDDGTLPDRRGSLSIDDEGTPTQRNVLIEDGILKGYLQDRLNARLMGVPATGNGRRESYACQPMPRMTNTFMLSGQHTPEEMIASVKNGIYAVHMGGGQVDITSGKFVFSLSEAYRIENGKVTHPIKGATLIGNGPESMQKIRMIGNDSALDPGIGTCGKSAQSVPVGVGQPTLLIDAMTVGGTQV